MSARSPLAAHAGSTVQLVGQNGADRLEALLTDHLEVCNDAPVELVDLYVIEDRELPGVAADLSKRITAAAPAFLPVVILQTNDDPLPTLDHDELVIDDVIRLPVDRQRLERRLAALLVRQQQSRELAASVDSLSARERELRRFKRAVDDTGTAIAITDPDGRIEYANTSFTELTGRATATVVGDPLRSVGRPEPTVDDDTFWHTLRTRRMWHGEVTIERATGDRHVTELTITPIETDHGSITGFVAAFVDVTERIERERTLRARESELDLLRQILTRYLRHNLRNDLNVIQGYAELIQEQHGRENHDMTAGRIVDAADRLLARAETARRYSDLLEREQGLEPIDVVGTVRDAIARVSDRYPAAAVDLDVPDACRIVASAGIDRALEGLIENAIKHNDDEEPQVRIEVLDCDGVRVAIEDNGPGIPEYELASLDQVRETPLTHSSGIGLWLSKWVIEGSEGRLEFEVDEDGTRVLVEFPPPSTVGVHGMAAADLKERERRLQTIIDRMTDAILEVNASWTVTFLDTRAATILDLDEGVVGASLWEVLVDARETGIEPTLREAMADRVATSIETHYPAIDAWLEVYVYPNFDGGLSVYFRDVTDRKQREFDLAVAQSRMELALTATDAAIWEWDLETDAVTTHPPIHPVFEARIDSPEAFFDGIHPNDRATVRTALETAIAADRPYDVEFRVLDDDGIKWAEGYGELREHGRRIVGVTRDITQQKRDERALEDRIRELGAIRETAELLDRADGPIPSVLAAVVDGRERSFAHADMAIVTLTVGEERYRSGVSGVPVATITASAETANGVPVSLEAGYVEAPPIGGDVSFCDEERFLIETIVRFVVEYLDRRHYVENLEHLQSIRAEVERMGGVGGWEYGLTEKSLVITTGTARIFGVDTTAITVAEARTYFDDEHWDQLEAAVREADVGGAGFELDCRITTHHGVERIIRLQGRHADDETLRGFVRDVTSRRAFEADLREQRRRFERLAETVPAIVYRADPDTLAPTYVSPDVVDVFGIPSGALLATPGQWEAAILPADAPDVLDAIGDHRRAGIAGDLEYRIRTATGEVRWVQNQFGWEHGPDGPTAMVGVITDVTERIRRKRELERKTAQLDAVLAHTTVPIFIKDTEGRYLLVNRAYLEQFDLEEDEVIGASDYDLHSDRIARAMATSDREALDRSEPIEHENRIVIDGGVRRYRLVTVPLALHDGFPDAVFGVATDVTDRIHQERALEWNRDRMDRLASVLNHDARNTLTIASGHLGLAGRDGENDHLEAVERSLKEFERLIEAVVHAARYTASVRRKRRVRLVEAATRACERHGVTLEHDIDEAATIRADPDLLATALDHCITDARARADSSVTIRIERCADGFAVADDGSVDNLVDRAPRNGDADVTTALMPLFVADIGTAHGWDVRVSTGRNRGRRVEFGDVLYDS